MILDSHDSLAKCRFKLEFIKTFFEYVPPQETDITRQACEGLTYILREVIEEIEEVEEAESEAEKGEAKEKAV